MSRDFHLTPAELAVPAQVHRKTIYRFIRDGKLEALTIGGRYRILASEAERFLGFRPEKPKPRKTAS
jgi:excisionase family DNA binding protein